MRKLIFLSFLIIFCVPVAKAQNLTGGGEANPDLLTNKASLEAWKDLRFGMFVHWGPVSLKGTEIGWSRGREVSFEEYDTLYKQFNPIQFDAAEWVGLMKEAGMKYLIFVSKHHDGFVMWDSQTTDYDIMSTPYGRDVMKDLSEECRRQGILFGTYYSICDWRNPDYPVEENNPVRREHADMEKHIIYIKAQLKELVENYHTKILWFDGEWEDPWTHEMGMDLYKYVRSLDEEILVNNRVDKGRQGMEGISLSDRFAGDFATPEKRVGRFDTLTPWESCITICEQWAWKPDDQLKSYQECFGTLVRTAGGDGNLLLNIGPMPDGRIEPRQANRLKEMGKWLEKNGTTIYGTRGGPIEPQKWGVSTSKDNLIYLHVLAPSKKIRMPFPEREILSIQTMHSNDQPVFKRSGQNLVIDLGKLEPQSEDLILVIEVK